MHFISRMIMTVTTVLLVGMILLSPTPSMGLGLSTTATPTPSADLDPERLAFPLTPPTDEQIKEAKACDLTDRPKALPRNFSPETACDWAMLAVAYANRAGKSDNVSPDAREALVKAISMNAAFSQALPLLAGYFGKVTIVEAPAIFQQPITSIKVEHSFSALGPSLKYLYTITDADTSAPVVKGTSTVNEAEKAISGTVDSKLVQALAAALTDLMPIRARFSLAPCWDDYPDWKVSLTFKDGTTLDLETNRSNVLFHGGPWQVVINDQRYMQFSPAFLEAALEITKALKLPLGETAAMGCTGIEDTLDAAYPDSASD